MVDITQATEPVSVQQNDYSDFIIDNPNNYRKDNNPVYESMASNNIYDVEKIEPSAFELPSGVAEKNSNLLSELLGKDVTLKTQADLESYIKVLDDNNYKNTEDFINAVSLDMAEGGVSPKDVISWRNSVISKRPEAYGSGIYSSLVDSRLNKLASEDSIARDNMLVGDTTIQQFTEAIQNYTVNRQMIDVKAQEATDRYDDQWITTKLAKGVLALVPGDQVITSMRISNKLKDLLELKETKYTKNDLYEAARNKLVSKAASLTPEEMKEFINEVDGLLLNGWFTYGERAEFWQQAINTNYQLNAAEFPLELVGLGWSGKTVSKVAKQAIKEGASKAAVTKTTTYAAMNEILPGSGIIGMAAESAIRRPIKKLLLVGQKKEASRLANTLKTAAAENALESGAERGKWLSDAGRQVMEADLTGLANTTKKLPMDIGSTTATKHIDAIVDSAVKAGMDGETMRSAVKLAQDIMQGSLIRQIKEGAKADIHRDFIEGINKALSKESKAVNTATTKTVNGVLETTARIGNGTSNTKGFKTWAEAKGVADKLKLDDNYMGFTANTKTDVVLENGSYWVEAKRTYKDALGGDVSLTDVIKQRMSKTAPKGVRETYSSSGLLGSVSSTLTVPHHIRKLNNVMQMDEGKTMEGLRKLRQTIDKGNGPVLDTLMNYTKANEAWLNTEWLKKIGVDNKTIEAYKGMKVIEDAEYLLNGRHILKSLEESGMKNVHVNGVRLGLGRTVTATDKKYLNFVSTDTEEFNLLSGIDTQTEKVTIAKVHRKDISMDDVEIIKMQKAINNSNYIVVHKNMLEMKDPSFSNVLMSYKPGRTNFASDSGFVKQVLKGKNTETGEQYISGISTLFAHYDAESVRRVAPVLEEMRQVAIKYKEANGAMSSTQAQQLFEAIPNREHTRFADFESFYKLCDGEDAVISLEKDSPLQFAFDGDKITLPEGFDEKDYNFRGASMMQFTNSEKAMKKKMRSDAEIFNPFTLDEAPRLNIDEELSEQVSKIVKYSTVNDYTDMMAEDFYHTFRNLPGMNMRNPKDALLHYDIDSIADPKIKAMAQNARNNYLRMISKPTEWDRKIEAVSQNIADWFAPGWNKALDDSMRAKMYKGFSTLSPVRKLRSFAFHWQLGMFNPRQLFVQSAASLNAAILSPKAAAKLNPISTLLTAYVTSGDESLLGRIVKTTGMSKEYLKDVVDGAKKLDIWSKGSYGGAYDISQRTKWWDNVGSTMFFDMGEHANRMYTAYLASAEALEKGIKLSEASPEVVAEYLTRQQNLYINMGRAGSSELQRGFGGVITQFRGYQMRALELMFDKTLTAGERARFLLLNAALGGTKGFVGPRFGSMIYNAMNDSQFNPVIAETLYNGAVDELIKENGGNYSLGEFFSTNTGGLLELALNPVDIENLPSVSTLKKGVGAVAGIVNGLRMFGNEDVTGDKFQNALFILQDLALQKKLPPLLNNSAAAYWIWETGKRLNSKGQLLDSELDTMDSVLSVLGFRRIDDDFSQAIFQSSKAFKENVEEFEKEGERIQGMIANATETDARKYTQLYHTMLSTLKEEEPQVQRAVLKGMMSKSNLKNYTVPQTQRLIEGYTKQTGHDYFIPQLKRELEQLQKRKENQ